jgi:hypothetical protein
LLNDIHDSVGNYRTSWIDYLTANGAGRDNSLGKEG